MKKVISSFFVCLLLILTPWHVSGNTNGLTNNQYEEINATDEIIPCDLLNGGWFEERDGIKILHLKGSFYEMGYQQGYFLKYDILRNLRGFKHAILEMGVSLEDFLELWNIQKNYISQEILDFINGTADAVGIPFDDVGSIWIWERTSHWHCSSIAAWGPATKSNEIIQTYSLDFSCCPIDPVTGISVFDTPVLIVADPDDGYAFIYPTFAGYVVESGVNEKGVSISNMVSKSQDENPYGSPVGTRVLEVLFRASSSDEAIEIINTNKTFGYNFVICDANKNIGYVVESTANLTYVGSWNNSIEATFPFYRINHVIRRTNAFINPETAATQREIYSPIDIRNFIGPYKSSGLFFLWRFYKAMSRGCEKYLEKLDLTTLLLVMKNVYNGRYGGLLWYLQRLASSDSIHSWYQWAASPRTGDILVKYASSGKDAQNNLIHHFNLFELLELEPP